MADNSALHPLPARLYVLFRTEPGSVKGNNSVVVYLTGGA